MSELIGTATSFDSHLSSVTNFSTRQSTAYHHRMFIISISSAFVSLYCSPLPVLTLPPAPSACLRVPLVSQPGDRCYGGVLR